ncbi:magnesium-translocating P-type ATPase [Candidatus Methylacidithermus pantelleriae]|uniref:Magnesium-transporting ATPase, P-type 1 n=1 Tax=Candidatus Methylacidithermus pantelleriae TaxID=2744239 RepID=A0A8J2BRN8_9BACT|nr:magnesium-translocating P-type ATPase [Candidatus Methylacidithermus pantelleriae]CAF0705064.1 Magnesium-transporting ATPase, P-type 1 [Candidatus Methylacidithermus pantelleriae]
MILSKPWNLPTYEEAASLSPEELFQRLESDAQGLSSLEAEKRLSLYGPNELVSEKPPGWGYRLYTAFRNPLVILLTILALLSFLTGDLRGAVVMSVMVALGVSLRFIQETRADAAAARLKKMIHVTATVLRDGQWQELALEDIVPGDVVRLSAGDMVPADIRLVSAKDLFLIQATLTGESMPVEKADSPDRRPGLSPLERSNLCFLGTSVESGSAVGLVLFTGRQTYLGKVASSLVAEEPPTAFDRGVQRFTWLMIRFMLVMAPLVFLINGLSKHNWKEAFFFAMAVAVGLTPEMLPMIVSVCLSKGALAMSRKKVIVRRLPSIQNLGAMDILCTDKTGTLTRDRVILEIYCDVFGNESEEVLHDAFLISHFQTGLKNVLDRAVLEHAELHKELNVGNYSKVDEIPFDFSRKMMSVVVESVDGQTLLLTKGAPEAVFGRCTHFQSDGKIFPMEPIFAGDLLEEVRNLSEDGFRVLAVAKKPLERRRLAYSKDDEEALILTGYLAFLDPPKDSAERAIAALRQEGVKVKVLTGDNDLVTKKVCEEVGLTAKRIILGSELDRMSPEELEEACENADIFARLSPTHKKLIVEALQKKGHVVGFLGDGINDAPALRVADVGISVDNAVDIAKESADVILLEKDLNVLAEGILEGRRVFVNIVKYIRMGASSNFGNMFSVVGASAWLPYLPMAPIQVLTNNLLYDFSQVPIPTDTVEPELVARPRPWELSSIAKFIVLIGPISSIFDYTTYAIMWFFFQCRNLQLVSPPELAARFAGAVDPDGTYAAALFHTGWFVESLMTQTLIIHVIRTSKIPFLQSQASWPLTVTTALIMAIGAWLPYSSFGSALGFVPLPRLYWAFLAATLLAYLALTQWVKHWLSRKGYL